MARALRLLGSRAEVHNRQVAERNRLNPTDLQCLGLLQIHGPMPAGALARALGLTTSATTTAIDRLERSGFAHREPDRADRRRVIVTLDQAQVDRRITPLYASKFGLTARAFARFSDAELATVAAFLEALEDDDPA